MDSRIVVELGQGATWANNVNLVLPCNDNGIVAAPLQVFGRDLGLGAVLAEACLEVACDYVQDARLRIQSNELAIGRDTDMGKGSNIKKPVFAVRGIYDVDRLVDTE